MSAPPGRSDGPGPRAYKVVTFYSFKGGVGRSMALANVAALLARSGRRVLVLDFDLEAPGIERYFDQPDLVWVTPSSPSTGQTGLVDLFIGLGDGGEVRWREHVVELDGSEFLAPVHLLPAGSRGEGYAARVQSLNWERLFSEHALGERLAALRDEWCKAYDLVLVDSRTGMSDIGGICTIILPDALVMLFTANSQSIEGTREVARLARAAQERLPVERARLLTVPILSRDDRGTEYEQSEHWRGVVAEAMRPFFDEWVSRGVTAEMVLQKLYLPQVAFWSFGERLPVVERPRELEDPRTLGSAYAQLARLVDADFEWSAIDEPWQARITQASGPPASPPPLPAPAYVPEEEPPAARPSIYYPLRDDHLLPNGVHEAALSAPGSPRRSLWLLLVLPVLLLVGALLALRPGAQMAPIPSPTPSAAPSAVLDVAAAQAVVASRSASPEQRLAALQSIVAAGAVPRNALLDGLILSGRVARLPGCIGCSADGADLRDLTLDNGTFAGTSMRKARLSGATLVGASLQDVDLSLGDLTGAAFDGAKLSRVRLDGATVSRSQLSAAQLIGTTGAPAWSAAVPPGVIEPAALLTRADQVLGGDRDRGWDVDVFWCEGAAAEASYASARSAALSVAAIAATGDAVGPGVTLGRVRLRMLSTANQTSGLFYRGAEDYVVEDGQPGEREAATRLAARLSGSDRRFSVKTNVRTLTRWYLSVFACAAPR